MGEDFGQLSARAVAAQRDLMVRYAEGKRFGQPLPRLEGAALDKFLVHDLTAAQKDSIRQAVAREFDRCRVELVFPKWVDFQNGKIRTDVTALVADAQAAAATNGFAVSRAKFEAAREIAWQGSVAAELGGVRVAEVNDPVRAASVELLDTHVNLAEWPIIAREVRQIADARTAAAELEKGIADIKAYPPIRTYTKILDDRVDALMQELVRLGVPKAATDALAQTTRAFMREAANLADNADKTDLRSAKAQTLDESAYRNLLAEYRAALRLYDCTEANTAKIIDWLAKQIATLLADLKRPKAAASVTTIVRLGASALNKRLEALRADVLKELDAALAKNAAFEKQIAGLLESGDAADAHAKIVAILTDDKATPAERAMAVRLLLTKVNPARWTAIERDIRAKTEEYGAAGKCVEGVAWIAAYPPVAVTDTDAAYEPDVDTDTPEVRLGANAINARLKKLKIECAGTLVARCAADKTAAGDFAAARADLRDIALTGDEDFDASVYAVRLAVLDTVVNPAQYAARAAEIEAKVAAFWEAGDFIGMKKWIDDYPYVHDVYPDLVASYDLLSGAMRGLGIAKASADGYLENLSGRVRDLIEKAKAEAATDLADLEKALDEFEKAFLAQYYDRMVSGTVRAGVRKEILALLETARDVPMSTWELNERLRAKIEAAVRVRADAADGDFAALTDGHLAALTAMLVDALDAAFSCDSQIAMAEDAIARQLGDTDPDAHLDANAVLGDYARAMRLIKRETLLTADLWAAVMFGAVYLDQPAVLERARKLNASVEGVSPRDPLKRTPLLLAVQLGRTSLIKRLSEIGATSKAVDARGDTSVHYAVRRGNIAVLKAMLMGNDVNATNAVGETALFIAARRNQPALADALIAAGATVAAANADGATAFDEACRLGSRDVLDALANAGAQYGPAQLALAAANDRLAVAQWLVAAGVDVNGPGVMKAAKPGSATERYLIGEGGVFERRAEGASK